MNIMKVDRLKWAGHIMRMGSADIPKRIITDNPGGHRGRGRPRTRWKDGVEEDLRKTGCRNLRNIAQHRMVQRKIIAEVKVV